MHPQHEHSIPSGSTTPRASGAANHNGTTGSHMPSRAEYGYTGYSKLNSFASKFQSCSPPIYSQDPHHAHSSPNDASPANQGSYSDRFGSPVLNSPFDPSPLRTSTTHSLQETPPIFPRRDAIQPESQPSEGSFVAIGDHLNSSSRNSTEASYRQLLQEGVPSDLKVALRGQNHGLTACCVVLMALALL